MMLLIAHCRYGVSENNWANWSSVGCQTISGLIAELYSSGSGLIGLRSASCE